MHHDKEEDEEEKVEESPEEHEVKVELNSILKKGPSKSWLSSIKFRVSH